MKTQHSQNKLIKIKLYIYPSAILCPAKVSFKNKGEIKAFSDTQRQKEFVTNRATLQDMLRKPVSSR